MVHLYEWRAYWEWIAGEVVGCGNLSGGLVVACGAVQTYNFCRFLGCSGTT